MNYNGANNIGMRYTRRGLQLSRRTVKSRLVPDTRTVKSGCGCIARLGAFEREFTD